MSDDSLKRLSRLTAILIQLQTKRLIQASELATRFMVSTRTIYRDIKALEQAGVPILTEEGRGYSLMEGYKVPPVMFSEKEANALILAEQWVLKNKDSSLVKDYSDAVDKVKAILRYTVKDKVNLLTERTRHTEAMEQERSSDVLSVIQQALTNYDLLQIDYVSREGEASRRSVEPFALVSTENWYLIAWCRLRKDFRFFRLDRIDSVLVLDEKFQAHDMTLQEFFDRDK